MDAGPDAAGRLRRVRKRRQGGGRRSRGQERTHGGFQQGRKAFLNFSADASL